MLQTLSIELNKMQTKSKQQDQRIENLYINFQEIYQISNNLNNPASTKHNMLYQVRPEVFNQILIFLDIKQILQFRLVSRRAKETIKLMLPIQIHNFQYLITEQQNEIQTKIQGVQEANNDPNQQQSLQAALDRISGLSRNHFLELKCMMKPPELAEKIVALVCLAIDPTFKIQKDNWQECQKRLSQQNFIELILNIDISRLSEKHLQQLEEVNSITEQQAAQKSFVASVLLIFLKAVVELRSSKLYITQYQIKELENKITKEQQLIDNLEKINNK